MEASYEKNHHRKKLSSFWGGVGAYIRAVPKGKLLQTVRVNRVCVSGDDAWARLTIRIACLTMLQSIFGFLGNALRKRPHSRMRGPARRAMIARILEQDSV